MKKFTVAFAVLATIALGGCTGPTAQPLPQSTSDAATPVAPATTDTPTPVETPTPDLTNLTLGAGVVVTGPDSSSNPFKMNVIVSSQKSSKNSLAAYGSNPKGAYVGFLVTYHCITGSCSYNPYDFTVRNEAGEQFERSIMDTFDPTLQSGNLSPNRNAKGYITYDLKAGKYFVEYSASILDSTPTSWTVTVK